MTDDDDFASHITSLLNEFDDRSRGRPHRSLNKNDLDYFRPETIKKKTCSRCGRTFFSVMGGSYYCSTRCQQDDRNESRREKRTVESAERKRKSKVRRCEATGCRNVLDPERSTLRFCSSACKQRAYRERLV
jgi:hypothetical protein